MADRATSWKLAVRTYPALQEFRDKLTHIMAEKQYEPLKNTLRNPESGISTELRKRLLIIQASSMANVLNHLYCQVDATQAEVDDPQPLSPESRVILHSVAGSPPYFAAIFLPLFYEDSLLNKLANDKPSINSLYTEFRRFIISNKMQYNFLHESQNEIAKDKHTSQRLVKDVINVARWKRVVVHRVKETLETPGQRSNNEQKRVVIDPKCPNAFEPHKYVHLSLEASHVIRPTSSELEYHILVQQDCPYSNEQLIEMVTMNCFAEHHNSTWFVGNVVFNLYNTVTRFKDFIDLSHSKLLINADARGCVKRSRLRQGESLDSTTKLVAMGDQVDQNGWIATPKNMEDIPKRVLRGMEDILGGGPEDGQKVQMKFELMRTSDFVLDGFVKVRWQCANTVLTC